MKKAVNKLSQGRQNTLLKLVLAVVMLLVVMLTVWFQKGRHQQLPSPKNTIISGTTPKPTGNKPAQPTKASASSTTSSSPVDGFDPVHPSLKDDFATIPTTGNNKVPKGDSILLRNYEVAVANFFAQKNKHTLALKRDEELKAMRQQLMKENGEIETHVRTLMKKQINDEKEARMKALKALDEQFETCDKLDVEGQRIPRLIHVVWKNETLFPAALKFDAEWREKEPCFPRKIATDADCREMANEFPGMQPHFDNFPQNVMRADTCRLLVVYFHGGIFMDLDIQWITPLKDWLNLTQPFVFGNETESGVAHYCNWFFAAERKNKCIELALRLIVQRFDRLTWDNIKANPHFVHSVTGPGLFTDALKSCPNAVPSLSRNEIRDTKIRHIYGSQRWKASKGYNSWMEWRSQQFRWTQLLYDDCDSPSYLQYAVSSDAEVYQQNCEHTYPWYHTKNYPANRPEVFLEKVSILDDNANCMEDGKPDYSVKACLHPVRHMFDDRLETYAIVHAAPDQYRNNQKTSKIMLVFGGRGVPWETVQCVRTFTSKWETAWQHAEVFVTWVGVEDDIIAETTKPNFVGAEIRWLNRPNPIYTYSISDAKRTKSKSKVKGIIIERRDDQNLEMAELKIYDSDQCTGHPVSLDGAIINDIRQRRDHPERFVNVSRAENVLTATDALQYFNDLVNVRDSPCRDVRQFGRTVDDLNVWGVCLDAPLAISHRELIDVDAIVDGYHFKSRENVYDPKDPTRIIGTKQKIIKQEKSEIEGLKRWHDLKKSRPCRVLSTAHTHYHSFQAALAQHGCDVVHVDGNEDDLFKVIQRGKVDIEVHGKHVLPVRVTNDLIMKNAKEDNHAWFHDVPDVRPETNVHTLMKEKGWDKLDIWVLDYTQSDLLHFIEDIEDLAVAGKLDQLMVELTMPHWDLTADIFKQRVLVSQLARVRKYFELVSYIAQGNNEGDPSLHQQGTVRVEDVPILLRHKLTFVRKGILKK